MNQVARSVKNLKKRRLFHFISRIEREFPDAEVFLVGGAVRDIFLGRECKDYDFIVRRVPMQKLQRFLLSLGRVDLVGRRFGVLKFIPKHGKKDISEGLVEPFDIALPRQEASILHTGHYRDFHITTNENLPLEEDLSRRDFTINALAVDMRTGRLVDPFGGLKDLAKKTIRTVGNPEDRFREDYSRMLRALRFSCTLAFRIEPGTARAIQTMIHDLNREIETPPHIKVRHDLPTTRVVPYEVIASEFLKTFIKDPVRAFDLYDSFHVFDTIVSELIAMKGCPQPREWHAEGDVWTHTRTALRILTSPAFLRACVALEKLYPSFKIRLSPTLIIATLFHDIGKPYTLKIPARDKVDRIRFDGHDRVGADMARENVRRLKLYVYSEYGVDPGDVGWLVKHHLLLLNSNFETLKKTTIEKYFFKNSFLGSTLLQLIFVDSKASKRADGRSSMGTYATFLRKLKAFLVQGGPRRVLPDPLLDGDEVMEILSLKQSPRVGELLYALREEQLALRVKTKKEARQFLISSFCKKNV